MPKQDGSGILSFSPRIQIREIERRWEKSPVPQRGVDPIEDFRIWDDTKFIIFDKQIFENFENEMSEIEKNWTFSGKTKIQRDKFKKNNGEISTKNLLVFCGNASMTTNVLLSNATIDIEIIEGPTKKKKGASFFLDSPGKIDAFKIKCTLENGERKPIQTITPRTSAFSKRKVINIKLSPKDFTWGERFTLTIEQEAQDQKKQCWAISRIRIRYFDQTISSLKNVSGSLFDRILSDNNVLNVNQDPTLVYTGSVKPGISDAFLVNEIDESLRPYEEQETEYESNDNLTFESPYKDKTKIKINLRTSTDTYIGAYAESSDSIRRSFMCYYDFDSSTWEKSNLYGISRSAVASGSTLEHLIATGCIGFSKNTEVSIDGEILDEEILNKSNEHTTTFGFPNHPKYAPREGQKIRASSLGINSPFLLEKVKIDFDCKLEISNSPTSDIKNAYSLKHFSSTGMKNDNYSCIAPTFFILRNFIYKNENESFQVRYNSYTSSLDIDYNVVPSIPGYFDGSLVQTSRELITYGQASFFISGSGDTIESSLFSLENNPEAFDKLTRDQNIFYTNINEITGNFSLDFPCRKSGNVINNNFYHQTSLSLYKGSYAYSGSLSLDNRGTRGIRKTSERSGRTSGLNFANFRQNRILSVSGGISQREEKFRVYISGDDYSPFLIMPEDELIFGWQFPLPHSNLGICNNRAYYQHRMSPGNTSITLLGSNIQNGKEYHQPIMQNFSPGIGEAIGNSSLLDRQDLSIRSEFSGSYLDDELVDETNTRFTSEYSLDRIGKFVRSKIGSIGEDNKSSRSTFIKIPNFKDDNRIFSDSLLSTTGSIEGAGISPKYYFDHKTFGHFASFFGQGKDTKFETRRDEKGAHVGYPVKVKNVSGSIRETKQYFLVSSSIPQLTASYTDF